MEGFEPKRPAADPVAAENLKHLARLIDQGVPLSQKINGRRVAMPAAAKLAINLDRDPRSGYVEVDIRWSAQFDNKEDAGPRAGNAGTSAGNAGAPACMSAKHEPDDGHQKVRDPSRPRATNAGPHIRLKALVTAPKI